MLQLRPNCECCNRDLPPESADAFICSFECTFCRACKENVLGGKCPPADKLAKNPPSAQRIYKPQGCGKAA